MNEDLQYLIELAEANYHKLEELQADVKKIKKTLGIIDVVPQDLPVQQPQKPINWDTQNVTVPEDLFKKIK